MVFERLRSGNYQHVPPSEMDEKKKGAAVVGDFKHRIAALSWRVKGLAIALLAILFFSMSFSGGASVQNVIPLADEEVVPEANFLHVLLPASHPDVNLCKTIISAGTLDYPVPSIITWNRTFEDSSAADGGIHVARIAAISNYLRMAINLPKGRARDVVLIADGYDTWFQLRPDVLLERFFEVNRKANNHLVKQLGQQVMDAQGIAQRIVFGAQKQCTRDPDDPACYAVPQSPLSRGVYGGNTDRGNARERFLNSGFIMGDLESLQKLVEKAEEIINANKETATMQSVFSKLFGEQEYQREVIRQTHVGKFPSFYHGLMRFLHLESQDVLRPHPTHRRVSPIDVFKSEFNVGLDYEGFLGHTTDAKDLDWITHNDTRSIMAVKAANKNPTGTSKHFIPEDIERSLTPFWTRNPEPKLPQELSWCDLSLFTNLWTGTIPATLQHTSPRSDSESIRRKSWNKLWMQPHARMLLDIHVNEPYRAFSVLRSAGTETAWWPMHPQKWRLRDHGNPDRKKEWIAWESICGEVWDEVFRDVKGVWKPPRFEY